MDRALEEERDSIKCLWNWFVLKKRIVHTQVSVTIELEEVFLSIFNLHSPQYSVNFALVLYIVDIFYLNSMKEFIELI